MRVAVMSRFQMSNWTMSVAWSTAIEWMTLPLRRFALKSTSRFMCTCVEWISSVFPYVELSASGGMINFFLEGKKVRFEINRPAAEAAGLKISSRLLRLAVLVEGEQ